ncbi:MAG: helix-turn-helix domain-containing protein [Thermoplasmatota archaeon]
MDGVRALTFRVQHDCPLAALSREVVELRVWSGHRLEVVAATCKDSAAGRASIQAHLHPEALLPTQDGWLALWRPQVDAKSSISRILEAHGLMWQQPLRVVGGWEHYDALAFDDGEQAALDALRAEHPTQVVRRQTVGVEDVTANLFQSLAPVLEAPTPKQVEALVAAHQSGYYQSPRACTTADLADRIGITRSSLEERLRGGENKLMHHLGPALALAR